MPSVWRVKSPQERSIDHAVAALVVHVGNVLRRADRVSDVDEAERMDAELVQLQADLQFIDLIDSDATIKPEQRHAAIHALIANATERKSCSPS